MNIVKYIFWLVAFLMGVIVAYVVPEETMSIGAKFIFVGAWGAVLGFVFYTVCKRQIESIENDFNEVLNRPQPKVTQFVPIHQQEDSLENCDTTAVSVSGQSAIIQSEGTYFVDGVLNNG